MTDREQLTNDKTPEAWQEKKRKKRPKTSNTGPVQRKRTWELKIKAFWYLTVTQEMEGTLEHHLIYTTLWRNCHGCPLSPVGKGNTNAGEAISNCGRFSFALIVLYLADTLKWVWEHKLQSGSIQHKIQRWNLWITIEFTRWTKVKWLNYHRT